MKVFPSLTAMLGLATLGVALTQTPATATQQLFCNGRMGNGWTYQAEFVNGRFTRVRWNRSGQPPQVSPLTFQRTNEKGQPIYRGGLFAAVTVTLIDLSKGEVAPGSQISVNVEEWGWSRGTCGLSSGR